MTSKEKKIMEMFTAGVDLLKSIVTILGGGMLVLGLIGLFQGYGDSNPAAKQTGLFQFLGGLGIILVAQTLVPMLANVG